MKCPYCGRAAKKVTGQHIYPHRIDLRTKQFYQCRPCGAWVGCHPDGRPLGSLANQLRKARIAAHTEFDKLWREGHMKRGQAYAWLNKEFGGDVHMSQSDIETCDIVAKLSRAKLALFREQAAASRAESA